MVYLAPPRRAQSACDEGFHHTGPGSGQVAAVVPAAAHPENATMAKLVGDPADRRRRPGMRLLAERHVGDRVAFEAVRPALEQDELRTGRAQVFLDARPGGDEIRVGRAGQHRQVELGAHGGTGASLACGTGPRIKVPTVLVYVGEQQIRVGFVGVENPVAMVGVDIDVSDAADAVTPSQQLDDDATVIEYAKTGRVRARRMM